MTVLSTPSVSSPSSPLASPLDVLLSRASRDDLVAPAPSGETLQKILSAGLRAPDHGKLRPWRYVVIEGEARVPFAHELLDAMSRQEPEATEKKREKRFARFSTVPAVLALGMHLRPDDKIPLWEQKMSVGAGVMNVLNALHMSGYGGVWISGPFCDDLQLRESLGLGGDDRLAGFMFIGTPAENRPASRRPAVEDYVSFWKPGQKTTFGADATDSRAPALSEKRLSEETRP